MFDDRRSGRHAIVLAAGVGSRLRSLTVCRDGRQVPKQYCSLFGRRSLLGDAIARAEAVVDRSNVVVVVASQHERLWRNDPALHGVHVAVQPMDRGTAVGLLLGVRAVAREDAASQVVLLPADHFFAEEDALAAGLSAAQDRAAPDRLLLVGTRPTSPDPEYGYVVPGERDAAGWRVQRFVEKPAAAEAAALIGQGAVWNTMMLVGSCRALLGLYERRLPHVIDRFGRTSPADGPAATAEVYARLEAVDLSRHVLQGAEADLDLVVLPECGFSDLGTAARVRECVASFRARAADRRAGALGEFDANLPVLERNCEVGGGAICGDGLAG